MTEREALVAAIATDPDDDTTRLAFADWLQENGEEDRAEFIRLHCEVARLDRADPRFREVWEQARNLFDQKWPSWIAPICKALDAEPTTPSDSPRTLIGQVLAKLKREPRACRYYPRGFRVGSAEVECSSNSSIRTLGFRRGCLEYLDLWLGCEYPLGDTPAAFNLEPITDLRVRFGPRTAEWRRLNSPYLKRVKTLHFETPPLRHRTAVQVFELLCNSANWPDSIQIRFSDRSWWEQPIAHWDLMHQFASSYLFERATSLEVHSNAAGVRHLVCRTPTRLTSFVARGSQRHDEPLATLSVEALRGQLVSLGLSRFRVEAQELRESPWPHLRTVNLTYCDLRDADILALRPLVPQLTRVDLSSNAITDAGAFALAEAINPDKLESLCLSYNPLSPEAVQRLRDRFGSRFEFVATVEEHLQLLMEYP